ncbi:high mobility group B protein 7 [Melia azedarach]|uniref:High mobility group B protein 7 n=1 Tax=Melia azedarach TaxID=155640 RepID=A0ACC1Y9E1_MELAZ|nr:high mobility group B protein 7 [Melia azedarach]
MGNRPRIRKRVHAIRRAPDGSAFQKCDSCGVMVPVALADMHECEAEAKNKVKKFKGVCQKPSVLKQSSYSDQVRSPFVFFMESFIKACKSGKRIDNDRKGFAAWKNMSNEEKQPYVLQAEKLYAAHQRALVEELTSMPVVDDEADSAMVGKYDKYYCDYEDFECSDSSGYDSLNSYEWEMVQPWMVGNSQKKLKTTLDDSLC